MNPVPRLVALALLLAAAARAEPLDLLGDSNAWPRASSGIELGTTGLTVAIPPGRGHAIAAAIFQLPRFGRIRVNVQPAGGAAWFIRLHGEVREAGRPRTIGVAQDETSTGERFFDIDPRLRTRLDAPLQVQLGVEGPPGASLRFAAVTLLDTPPRPNVRAGAGQPGQVALPAVERMPNLPAPYAMINWRAKAREYDRFVFDLSARGEHLPLLWLDEARVNIDRPAFGLPSYVGAPTRGQPGAAEGITCLGALLGATVAGVDKSRQAHDYVAMAEAWFNSKNGLDLVLNNPRGGTGGSFWYELFPHIVFYALADRYPDHPRLGAIMRTTADRWREAVAALSDSNGVPNFDHTSYNFATRQPVDNGKWREPDAAAAVAWLEYAAWMTFGDSNHLAAVEASLRFLQAFPRNPHYEVLLPFGALAAARLNAEQGRGYDVDRLLNWCFEPSDTRGGWGVTVGRWGDFDCDGLVGSIDNRGGYAFAMNTFVQAAALAPLARYDARYARALGKWLLNLANAARLFYPGALPPGHESGGAWTNDPQHAIAYEGLRYAWQGRTPCATGDPVAMRWGPKTDLGLYGSSYVGLLGGLVSTTDVPALLRIDCLATDFCRGPAHPTFLYYNPHAEPRAVTLAVGDAPRDIYDAVAHRFLARSATGAARLEVPADSAVVAVLTPAGSAVARAGRTLRLDGVAVDFAAPAEY